MTLLDIKNQLLAHLCVNDTLSVSQLKSFVVEGQYEQSQDALIRAVIGDFVNAGLLRYIENGADSYWILSQPIGAGGQEVGISLPTCTRIAVTINSFLAAQNAADQDELVSPFGDRVDALNIREDHIDFLMDIIDDLVSSE